MRTSDFHFDLPNELIAQQPCEQRSGSRLLHLTRQSGDSLGRIEHLQFKQLPNLIKQNDLLVFNNTRVIPARLFGRKATGGKLEVLVERLIDEQSCLAHVRASKTPKAGAQIYIDNDNADFELTIEGRQDDLFIIRCADTDRFSDIMQQAGHMPLPPYITRADEAIDFERYQTVYSSRPGAVAAPTAGLHFDEALLMKLADKGVRSTYVTLHVGAGTFQPVRAENIKDHQMHAEYIEVSPETVELCRQTREQGGRIVAVGTTSVRALESASRDGQLEAFTGDTDIFIYPGYQFRSVDAMITNFHLPESTLLMLVSAFAGRESIMNAYEQAVAERYRFFSYGDAMLID